MGKEDKRECATLYSDENDVKPICASVAWQPGCFVKENNNKTRSVFVYACIKD